jgi:hypothetical protein
MLRCLENGILSKLAAHSWTVVAAHQRSFREFAGPFAWRGRSAPPGHRTCSDCCRW